MWQITKCANNLKFTLNKIHIYTFELFTWKFIKKQFYMICMYYFRESFQ